MACTRMVTDIRMDRCMDSWTDTILKLDKYTLLKSFINIFQLVIKLRHAQDLYISIKSNQRDITLKVTESNPTIGPNLIHIPMKLHEDIPELWCIQECLKKLIEGA